MSLSYRFFESDDCAACGACLTKCRYLAFPEAKARRARERLRAGEPVPEVLSRCVSCYACDAVCPRGLHPYEAILEFWNARYERVGLPERARFLMPGAAPNLRAYLVERLPADERAQAAAWNRTPARMTGTVLYPGCNLITLPHLAQSRALDGIAIHGGLDLCCGEMYYRMGLFGEVDRIARTLTAFYAAHAIEEMLFVCPACYNMFAHVLPEQFGARFSFRTRFLTDLLLERLAGAVPRPLGLRVAVHDSCHARVLGASFLARQRDLLRVLGVTPVETGDDLARGHCCGIAAGCARQSPVDIARVAGSALRAAGRAGVDEIAVYCGGCLLVLSMVRQVVPRAPRVRHVLEYVGRAIDSPVPSRAAARARTAAWGVATHALPRLLSRGRFRIT